MSRRLFVPIYQLGNPQLRIFRPNWFLTLVRPGKEQPPDTAQFRNTNGGPFCVESACSPVHAGVFCCIGSPVALNCPLGECESEWVCDCGPETDW
uniref:Uncharacterized protein n=1 Tax=Oryzias sinensis TaxID=183150 RepID=A0A8C7ZCQ5_9TELE